jgi:magnesium transporter
MLKSFKIESGKIAPCPVDGAEILIYVNPDETERRGLVDNYKLDEHTLNSALDPDELARVEYEPDHRALIFKSPKNYSGGETFLFTVSSYGIFWFKEKLIVVMAEEMPLFEGKIFNRISTLEDVFLGVIYRTIYHYLNHLKVINMISDSLEQKINTSMKNKYLINLFTLEKSLVYYLNAINSNAFVIERLKQHSQRLGFSEWNVELLDDILIENNQCYRQAEIYSNILAGLMDARVSIVSNNLNILMKTLNIITIAIMVPTFIVSAFSMNVTIPLSQYNWAFWAILGFAGLGVLSFSMLWRYKRW